MSLLSLKLIMFISPSFVLLFDIVGRFTSGMDNCYSRTCCNRIEFIYSRAPDVTCRYVTGNGIGHVHRADYMMIVLKRWRTKRKVNKILDDIVQMRKEQTSIEEKDEERAQEQ